MAKFYVVWKGRNTGIFNSWDECKAQIDGFPGAKFKSFPTRIAAENALNNNTEQEPSGFIKESICVDAAWNTETKDLEFQAVNTPDKTLIFHRGPMKDGTINIGEYLAIVLALEYCRKHHLEHLPIYSDSNTAIKWVKDKKTNTRVTPTSDNQTLLHHLQIATELLHKHNYINPLLKWNTKEWGENPADFGRK
jgi:ribonuclease HI